jgi:hypothetical protein
MLGYVRAFTLAKLNAVRLAYGIPALEDLPCGVPGSPHDCPVKRGLEWLDGEAEVSGSCIWFSGSWGEMAANAMGAKYWTPHDRESVLVWMPWRMRLFVRLFDGLHFKDLAATSDENDSASDQPNEGEAITPSVVQELQLTR